MTNEEATKERTIHECRGCGTGTWGLTDGTCLTPGWGRLENIDGPNALCPDCLGELPRLEEILADFRADGYENVRVACKQG